MATPFDVDAYEDDEDDLDDEDALAALIADGCAAASAPPPPQAAATASPVAWTELMAKRAREMDVVEARRILASQSTFEGKDACGLRTLQITLELEMLAEDQEELIDMMSAISDKDNDGKFVDKKARGRCVRGRMHMRALATARAQYFPRSPPPPPPPVRKPVIEKGDPAFSGTRGRARAASLLNDYETKCRIHAVKMRAHQKRVAQHESEMEKLKDKAMSAIAYLGNHFPRRGTYAAAKAQWLARARELAGDGAKAAPASAVSVPAQLWTEEEHNANQAGLAKRKQLATRRAKRDRERSVEEAIVDAEREEIEELQATAKRGYGTIEGWRAGVGLAVAICKRWKRTLNKPKHALPERDANADKMEFYDLLHPKTPTVAAARDTAWIREWEADTEVFAGGAADEPPAVVVAAPSSSSSLAERAKP